MTDQRHEPSWTPDPERAAGSRMVEFTRSLGQLHPLGFAVDDYHALQKWSVRHIPEFWAAVWDYFDVITHTPYTSVVADPTMPGHGWFSGATLNYAEHALRFGADTAAAIINVSEAGDQTTLSWGQLRSQVGSLAEWLRRRGVGAGDTVVGYLPNGAHSVVAFLATASVGAIWSCCAPDYGVPGALSRFAQLEPVVLFAADGMRWNGQTLDKRSHTADLRAGLPTVQYAVRVDHIGFADLPTQSDAVAADDAVDWAEAVGGEHELRIDPVAAESPLWVLFSSGTTGIPKGIVHSHAGVVVEHLKQLGLHFDLRPGDRFFWYTSTNWMMWNLQVSALLLGATIITYDGSPTGQGPDTLWRLAAEHRVNVLGTSPAYLAACANAEVQPARDNDLTALRILGVTGSPMAPASYDWVYDHLDRRVQVSCGAGGTDVVAAFATSNPLTPVWAGELSGAALGVALESWDADGEPVVDTVGELVITAAMPSMPLRFWNDADGQRYQEAYFDVYPGVWRHGDWVVFTSRGGIVFTGRSDSTLNRNGVRMGSADVYAAIQDITELRDYLVVGAELGGGRYWMPLFVELGDGVSLDGALRQRIRMAIATKASPRHVPDDVIAVPGIPHTRTGKRLEVPVKRILQGSEVTQVVNRDAVDRAELLDHFASLRPPAAATVR